MDTSAQQGLDLATRRLRDCAAEAFGFPRAPADAEEARRAVVRGREWADRLLACVNAYDEAVRVEAGVR